MEADWPLQAEWAEVTARCWGESGIRALATGAIGGVGGFSGEIEVGEAELTKRVVVSEVEAALAREATARAVRRALREKAAARKREREAAAQQAAQREAERAARAERARQRAVQAHYRAMQRLTDAQYWARQMGYPPMTPSEAAAVWARRYADIVAAERRE